jgi:hypothetical protein
LLPNEAIFADLPLHGNTNWTPAALVWLALCWAWSDARNLTDAFEAAVVQCRQLGIQALGTYQGLMMALARWSDRLLAVLWPMLHERMRRIGGRYYRIGGWVPIAFDGSRSALPRTRSNEQAYCAAHYGRGKTAQYRRKKTKGMRRRKNQRNPPHPPAPQVWVTLLWHMGLRLPWQWRLGPSNSSERAHVLQMLEGGHFPKQTLFCGDAGFVGYPLWSAILASGHHFLIRVGANVDLLTQAADCKVKKNGAVLCWPKVVRESGQSPLRLRLVKVTIGKTPMWMLTSVQECSRLSKAQIVEFYQMRWGVEVEFRGLKQTLDRAKLRCRNDRRVLVELNWSILAMAVAELFALKEQLAKEACDPNATARPANPKHRSLAQAVRALRECFHRLTEVPVPGKDLATRLRQAVTDGYCRRSSKQARYHPHNPDKKPLGDPTIRTLHPCERKALHAIQQLAA